MFQYHPVCTAEDASQYLVSGVMHLKTASYICFRYPSPWCHLLPAPSCFSFISRAIFGPSHGGTPSLSESGPFHPMQTRQCAGTVRQSCLAFDTQF